MCLFLCVIRRPWDPLPAEPINNLAVLHVVHGYKTLSHKIELNCNYTWARNEDVLAESFEASGHTEQVFGPYQSDISGSDIDISALLNSFDQNSLLSFPTVKNQNKVRQLGHVSQGWGSAGGG